MQEKIKNVIDALNVLITDDSVSLILKDSENLSTQQALLLETVKQSLQLALEHIRNDRQHDIEKACKNQAYDFILTERLLNRFKLFCSCHPVNTYIEVNGIDIVSK